MRILLVRHGESEGNHDPLAYLTKGENVGLTKRGWLQAQANGKFLEGYYGHDNPKWPVVYVSSLLRPKQTFRGMYEGGLKNSFPGTPKLYEDPRLIEKYFGAASHLYHEKDGLSAEEMAVRTAILKLSKKVYDLDPFTAANLFGESTKQTYIAVKSFLDGTFARDCAEGKDDFLIVCHGAIIQSFLMAWAHLPIAAKKQLGNPDNCDVIEITGHPKDWTVRRIWNGADMVGVDEDALKGIRPFSFSDLPPVPDFFSP